jgi:hypothetical protein
MEEKILGNLVTETGRIRCRFDMLIRWPDHAGRRINPFTMRGDRFGIIEPDKMLCSLLKYFVKDHRKWMFCELYDNTKPLNEANRLILEYKKGKIIKNILPKHYSEMLEQFPLPEYLKTNIEEEL